MRSSVVQWPNMLDGGRTCNMGVLIHAERVLITEEKGELIAYRVSEQAQATYSKVADLDMKDDMAEEATLVAEGKKNPDVLKGYSELYHRMVNNNWTA